MDLIEKIDFKILPYYVFALWGIFPLFPKQKTHLLQGAIFRILSIQLVHGCFIL